MIEVLMNIDLGAVFNDALHNILTRLYEFFLSLFFNITRAMFVAGILGFKHDLYEKNRIVVVNDDNVGDGKIFRWNKVKLARRHHSYIKNMYLHHPHYRHRRIDSHEKKMGFALTAAAFIHYFTQLRVHTVPPRYPQRGMPGNT